MRPLGVLLACLLIGCGTVSADPQADGGTGGAAGKIGVESGSGGAAGSIVASTGGTGQAGTPGTGGVAAAGASGEDGGVRCSSSVGCPQAEPVCINGYCSSSCSAGQVQCGTGCTTTATDSNNCGSCGTVCPVGAGCSVGQCSCSGGEKICGLSCVNTAADNSNCGGCGKICGSGKNCTNGVCLAASA